MGLVSLMPYRFDSLQKGMIMKSTHMMQGLICFFLVLSVRADSLTPNPSQEMDKLMTTLHERGQFNGSVLVAVGGRVIYRKAFGEADFQSHQKLTLSMPSCLASVAKQFTAMIIMMLAERKKLNYDDLVSKYIPELPPYAGEITLRHLLTHTSSIPDVGDLGIDRPGLTDDELLKTLSKPSSYPFKPGQKYRYSNTGYMLLSLIIERVSGQHYPDLLDQWIFKPLGMTNTFFMDQGSSHPPKPTAVGYSQFGKLSTGSSGIYSTVDNLLKWDRALYTERLVKKSTLAMAFTPAVVKEGETTYGFGWNVSGATDHKSVWHTGNTDGYRAFIERRLTDRATVILLTNKGNSKRLQIKEAIFNLLDGRPYRLPQRSISEKMYEMIHQQGLQSAIRMYDSLRAAHDADYDFAEAELNSLGYQLLSESKMNEALRVFESNTVAYPASSNAFDSLAEAYLNIGNKEQAVKNYRKAVALDPDNMNARNRLEKIR
jgi:CubicO group peptidase (beta-lactamase class C family)